jgi:hypothetical protein
MSADGAKMVASLGQPPSLLYVSSDSGVTWAATDAPGTNWAAVASSADGLALVAVVAGGPIYTSQTVSRPELSLSVGEGVLLLSWMLPWKSFVVQQSADLSTYSWADLTNVPALNFSNLHNEIMITTPTGMMFYRLVGR